MSLVIAGMPHCGFGNRLLYYYNLRQEAHERGCNFFSVPWDGHQWFAGDLLGKYDHNSQYEIFDFCLGEKFFSYNSLSTRDVFKLKIVPQRMSGVCAVHFRGTDFHSWNPDSILKYQYYCDSIEYLKEEVSQFMLFTDDKSLESYQKVMQLLDDEKINWSCGDDFADGQLYINDFAFMTECDYIISSPSTFCICAGFIGKQKKIIHSKEWVMSRVEKEDKFWTDLYDGGNQDYKLWKEI